jgi:pimeloyl-ACP methyl ester carboxylesterase
MKAVSKALLVLLALLIVVFAVWFFFFLKPDASIDAARERELLGSAASQDVVIIFNSGGWGNTPPEAASDFEPILAGIQDSLDRRGYSSLVTPFVRTSKGLRGKLEDVKDLVYSLTYSSEALAGEVDFILESFPGKTVVIAGFSNGGGLSAAAMKRLDDRQDVYAIVAGVPRFLLEYESDRMLVLDNDGKDKIAAGDYPVVALAVIEAPFKWLWAKINRRELSLALAIEIPGHEYPWSSSEVGPPIEDFLNARFPAK